MEHLKRKTFFTESEMEESLTSVTRELPGLDGKLFTHTNFKLYWECFDYLILCRRVSKAEIVQQAQEYVDEEEATFEDGFRWAISEFYYARI